MIEELYELTKGDAFITSDVGQHQMWAAQYYKFDKPRRWINSGGLGTMGFGLPAAMGVQMVNPDATVACVTGEASIQMCIQELSTCKQYHSADQDREPEQPLHGHGAAVAAVLLRQPLRRVVHGRAAGLREARRGATATSGLKIEKPGDVEGALKEAFAQKERLVFLDFITDQTENVFPMVPGGKGLTEMILAEEL